MRPKTKYHKEVFGLYKTLGKITKAHEKWVSGNLSNYYAHGNKKKLTCFVCGHQWDQTDKTYKKETVKCPCCKKTLNVDYSKKRVHRINYIFQIVTTVERFQVIRTFEVYVHLKFGEKQRLTIVEIFQQWFNENKKEKNVVIALNRNAFGNYSYGWLYNSDFEIRPHPNNYCYHPDVDLVYPKINVLPIFQRNGFNNNFHGYRPWFFLNSLLESSHAETLLKAGQIKLFSVHYSEKFEKYWSSVKICIRNNYIVDKPNIWLDYLDALVYLKMDVRNAKYVCPENLMEAHDFYISIANKRREKERLIAERQRKLEILRKLQLEKKQYVKDKKKFFDLVISDKNLNISVLPTVEDFETVNIITGCCIYSSAYYAKKDSLIMVVRKDQEIVQVVEISLNTLKVIQCYGPHNEVNEFTEPTISLINKNINQIQKRLKNGNPTRSISRSKKVVA